MSKKKVDAVETVTSEYMTTAQFQREIIPWSLDTIKSYIESEGLPASKTRGGYIFNRKAIREWFKKREIQAS